VVTEWTWDGMPAMQSWAEAVAAVGTAAGFLIAAVVYWRAEQDRRADHAVQAPMVFPEIRHEPVDGTDTKAVRTVVSAVNASSEPVFTPYVMAMWRGSESIALNSWQEYDPPDVPLLRPGATSDLLYLIRDEPLTGLEVMIAFTDNHGRTWVRQSIRSRRRTDTPMTIRRLRQTIRP
jgi:hypothetical protein